MKFSAQEVLKLEAFGLQVEEYCEGKENSFPIDCAVVHFRNNEYPCKINHGFFEAFFVLEGEREILFEDETAVSLQKHDFYVIEPEKKHVTRAKFADLVVCCTPPFEIRNVEFCEFFKENT